MNQVRWLSEQEGEAWRQLQLMQLQLTAVLSRQLADEAGLSYQDYLVLVALTGAPSGRMRAFELGHVLGWEKSRLSHHVSRMAERGLVRRERCDTDQRGAFIAVTKRGRRTIEAAAPGHVAAVRRYFVDLLSPWELEAISTIAARVRGRLAEAADEAPAGNS